MYFNLKCCIKCKETKELSEFYKRKDSSDGRGNDCKVCNKQKVKNWANANKAHRSEYGKVYREKNADKAKARSKIWREVNKDRHTESCKTWKKANPVRVAEMQREYRAAHPLKVKARSAISTAIRSGKLIPQPCVECGKVKTEGHHISYAPKHRLDVVWLCKSCHEERHLQLDKCNEAVAL